MTTTHFLQALTGLDVGSIFMLSARSVIGRSAEAAVHVMDPLASREHATLTIEDGIAVLSDFSSANGTFVGDERVHRRLLRSGDVFRIGTSEFVYCEVEGTIDDPELMTQVVKVLNLHAIRKDTLVEKTLLDIRLRLGHPKAIPNEIHGAPITPRSACGDPLHDRAAVRGWAHCPACGRPIQS